MITEEQVEQGHADAKQSIFIIRLRAEPHVDAIKALRTFLKTALRRFGLRAVSVDTERQPDDDFNVYAEQEAYRAYRELAPEQRAEMRRMMDRKWRDLPCTEPLKPARWPMPDHLKK